jgi:hypothetical protein
MYQRVAVWLEKLSSRWRLGITFLSGMIVTGFWLTSIASPAKEYFALNWFVAVALLLSTAPDQATTFRWHLILVGGIILLMLPTFVYALGERFYTPDEAQWADYASSAWQAGGIYSRTWLQNPVPISPGLGWSVAAYGWMLEHIAFRLETGRVWNFIIFLVGFASIGAVTWRLYGWRAALISVTFAALGKQFFSYVEYRPDHQLLIAAMWPTFAAAQARFGKRSRNLWHALCGLLAVLALELHAAAIAVLCGFALLYLVDTLWAISRREAGRTRWEILQPALWFFGGAALGAAIYYVCNILPAGGLGVYLDTLLGTRWAKRPKYYSFLYWLSLFEAGVVLASLTFILWRRSRADQFIIKLTLFVIIGIILFDPQGYSTHYSPFYIVPVGAFIMEAFRSPEIPANRSWRTAGIALALFVMLAAQNTGDLVNWQSVRLWAQTGNLPPFLYTELKPFLQPLIRDEDVIVTTHQLIWAFPYQPHLISYGAEETAMARWNLSNAEEVWKRVKPTVVIEVENQMSISDELRLYMAAHSFQTCQHFTVMGYNVKVYRPDCEGVS